MATCCPPTTWSSCPQPPNTTLAAIPALQLLITTTPLNSWVKILVRVFHTFRPRTPPTTPTTTPTGDPCSPCSLNNNIILTNLSSIMEVQRRPPITPALASSLYRGPRRPPREPYKAYIILLAIQLSIVYHMLTMVRDNLYTRDPRVRDQIARGVSRRPRPPLQPPPQWLPCNKNINNSSISRPRRSLNCLQACPYNLSNNYMSPSAPAKSR